MRRAGWLLAVSLGALAGCEDPSPMDLQPLPEFKKVPPRPDPNAVSTPPERRGPPDLVPTDEVLDGGGAAAKAMAAPSVLEKMPSPLTEANILSWAKMIDEFAATPAVAKLGGGNSMGLGQEPHMVLLSPVYQEAWKKAQQHAGLDDDQVLRLNSLNSIFVMQLSLIKPSSNVTAEQLKSKNNLAAIQAKTGALDGELPRFESLRSAFGDVAVDAVIKHRDRLRPCENKRAAYQSWARLEAAKPVLDVVNVRQPTLVTPITSPAQLSQSVAKRVKDAKAAPKPGHGPGHQAGQKPAPKSAGPFNEP
jgi:hypothetical protein